MTKGKEKGKGKAKVREGNMNRSGNSRSVHSRSANQVNNSALSMSATRLNNSRSAPSGSSSTNRPNSMPEMMIAGNPPTSIQAGEILDSIKSLRPENYQGMTAEQRADLPRIAKRYNLVFPKEMLGNSRYKYTGTYYKKRFSNYVPRTANMREVMNHMAGNLYNPNTNPNPKHNYFNRARNGMVHKMGGKGAILIFDPIKRTLDRRDYTNSLLQRAKIEATRRMNAYNSHMKSSRRLSNEGHLMRLWELIRHLEYRIRINPNPNNIEYLERLKQNAMRYWNHK